MKNEKPKSNFLRFITIAGDILLINLAIYLTFLIIFRLEPRNYNLKAFYAAIPYISVATFIIFQIYGLYRFLYKPISEIIYSIGLSLVIIMLTTISVTFFIRGFSFPRSVIVISPIVQFGILCCWRLLIWKIKRLKHGIKDIVIIGNQEELSDVAEKIYSGSSELYNITCINSAQPQNRIYQSIDNSDDVLICEAIDENKKSDLISYSNKRNKKIYTIPNLYDILISNSKVFQFDDIPVFQISTLGLTTEQKIIKRVFDLAFSSIGLIIALPIILVVAVLIKMDSKGPVFYLQERITQNNKVFNVIKFRTMVVDAEKEVGPILALDRDPRVTNIGRIIRATRLDEIPQLLNVLKGDMSLIGPRPERKFFIDQFKREIPNYDYRHLVKAGITGLAQVQGKYTTNAKDKLRFELMYIKKYSLFMDVKIALQTIKTVFMKESSDGVIDKKRHEKVFTSNQQNVFSEIVTTSEDKADVMSM